MDVDVDVPIIHHQISVIFQYFVTKKLVPDEIILLNKYLYQYITVFQNHVNIELYFKIMITVLINMIDPQMKYTQFRLNNARVLLLV